MMTASTQAADSECREVMQNCVGEPRTGFIEVGFCEAASEGVEWGGGIELGGGRMRVAKAMGIEPLRVRVLGSGPSLGRGCSRGRGLEGEEFMQVLSCAFLVHKVAYGRSHLAHHWLSGIRPCITLRSCVVDLCLLSWPRTCFTNRP